MRVPVVVGLDLSLTAAGVAVIRASDEVRLWTVGAVGRKGASLDERRRRVVTQHQAIVDVLREDLWRGSEPADAVIAVEGPSLGSVHGQQHDRSGLWWWSVATLGMRWPVVEISPKTRAKYATGNGNARKPEVLAAVRARWPHLHIADDNQADALVLAAAVRRWLGHPIDPGLPQNHLDALTAVKWPTQEGQTA